MFSLHHRKIVQFSIAILMFEIVFVTFHLFVVFKPFTTYRAGELKLVTVKSHMSSQIPYISIQICTLITVMHHFMSKNICILL